MKKRNLMGIMLLLGAMAMPCHAQVSNDNEDEVNKVDMRLAKNDYVEGQVLVKFKDQTRVGIRRAKDKFLSADRSAVNEVLQKYGTEEMEQLMPREKAGRTLRKARAYNGTIVAEKDLSQLYCVRLAVEHQHETLQLIDDLKQLDEVEFAEPNYRLYIMDGGICDDYAGNSLATQQWYLDSYGVKQLWDKPLINSKRPVIAILDTGVDVTHPDLVDNIWTNTAEADGEDGYDNDNNGFKNDVHGWDFINQTGTIRDYNMHGTHVAGIAAASNNDIGIVGANPMALLMPITVMQSDGTGDVATIVKGIDYAVANGADVLNLSLGTYSNSRALRQALELAYQTTVIVAAAGNDGKCINTNHYPDPCKLVSPMFPAAYSFVLGVQATTNTGALAGFSNYDDDGNTFSSITTLQDPDGFNYELKAPGANILSTIPGGNYKVLNGTSMASPLVAGAISALKMVKEYNSQEILWGDLLHTSNIAEAYAVAERPAELDLMQLQMRERKELGEETEEDYSGDHEIDAGETVSIYPVVRTTFGEASNIRMHLEMGDEFEDASLVEFLTDEVDFGWHLDAYGKGVSLNPLQLKVADSVADNRHIKLKIVATCDETSITYEWPFTIVVTNMVKISGLISEDRTLTADHIYLVNENLGVMEGATLTIEPGARLEFMEGMGLSSYGRLIAKGTPERPIVFTGYHGARWEGVQSHRSTGNNPRDTISYCRIDGFRYSNTTIYYPYMENCEISSYKDYGYFFSDLDGYRNTISGVESVWGDRISSSLTHSNIVNNNLHTSSLGAKALPKYSNLVYNNYFNNSAKCNSTGKYYQKEYWLANNTQTPNVDYSANPSYLGTSCEDIIRPYIYEIGNAPGTFGQIDLSNMPNRPYSEPHGIVWKVVVNGKDAQDEYEDLAPLGVGRHKFEVYFNRPMNVNVAPSISFGVREPWTQHVVAEDGSWSADSLIYTAYVTITGKTKSDGVNRIYVYGAEDNEYFECPYEKSRFNVMINAAGSMATGFAAEAGLGRVNLTWNNENNDFEDAMGFNVYRYGESYQKILPAGWRDGTYYSKPDTIMVADTVRINQEIVDIEATSYTDYDVTPGETYYYYYKVLSTDLQEYDVSNVVAVTPLTGELGDANGSGDVDVADVITTVNYAAGQQPRPFIFEAADMNTDLSIDILDVIGIIKKILHPEAEVKAAISATATYTVEDGTLYVESPVALAGVQVLLSLTPTPSPKGEGSIRVAEDLNGFEHTSAWLSDNDYLFLAYSMGGKSLSAGKHALLHIGEAKIADIRLSDCDGHNVKAEGDEQTRVDRIIESMTVKGVYDLQGRKLYGTPDNVKLPKGVYIINGKKVIR